MATDQPTFPITSIIAHSLIDLFQPLIDASAHDDAVRQVLAAIGWRADALPIPLAAVRQAIQSVTTSTTALVNFTTQDSQDFPSGLAAVTQVTEAAATVGKAIADISKLASSVSSPPPGLDQLGADLSIWLLDSYLQRVHGSWRTAATLLTLYTPQELAPLQPAVTDSMGKVLRDPYRLPGLHPDRLGTLLSNPGALLKNTYLPAGALDTPAAIGATADALFPLLGNALETLGLEAQYGMDPYWDLGLDPPNAAVLQHALTVWFSDSGPAFGEGDVAGISIAVYPPDASTNFKPALVIAPVLPSLDTGLGGWHATLDVRTAGAPLSIIDWTATPADSSPWPGLDVTLAVQSGGDPPSAGAVTPVSPGVQVKVRLVVAGNGVTASFALTGYANLKLSSADFADGFLSRVLPADGLSMNLQASLAYDQKAWHLTGSTPSGGVFELSSAGPIRLGPVVLDALKIVLQLASTAAVLTGQTDVYLTIGPVSAVIHALGVRATVGWPTGGGNAGRLDMQLGFKSPDGIGLAIAAPPVSGSGFLKFDPSNGQYLGEVSLTVADVSIQAVGVLTTRASSGAPDYSLIVLASAGFPPVELGFGFDLVGLGGLVGVNRTVSVLGLQALARAGALDNLMFPADLKHNAPQVAASLATLFPPSEGHFIVGPAVRLAWGTSGILDAEIAVYFELTESGGGISLLRVALLGWMHLTLPNAKAPVADINLDVLGVVDLQAKTLSIDAGLRNSKIAGFTLTGQAALRASWGANPAFVLAIGGFNPHFAAPAGFPLLDRIALSLGGNDPRLRMTAYLALTSNTLQLGATADLYASAGPAAVAASLSFDALIQYKPFGLVVDLSISASVLVDGSPLLSLLLQLHVIGPDPWHITGIASFQILFVSFSVPINLTVGPAPPPQLTQPVDLDGNLEAALLDLHSWQTGPPPGGGLVVIRGLAAADPAVHPQGTLTVRQHAVPLGQRIVRYGPDLLDAPCQYDIADPRIAGTPDQNISPVMDYFAPSQFNTMTDAEKLSSPSFQPMTSGLTFGPAGFVLPAGGASKATVDTVSSQNFYTLVVDSPDPVAGNVAPLVKSTASAPVVVPRSLLATQQAGAAAALNGSGGQAAARYAVPGGATPGSAIRLLRPTYAVVDRNLGSLGPAGPPIGLPSHIAALGNLASMGAVGGGGQVVYSSEVPGGSN